MAYRWKRQTLKTTKVIIGHAIIVDACFKIIKITTSIKTLNVFVFKRVISISLLIYAQITKSKCMNMARN